MIQIKFHIHMELLIVIGLYSWLPHGYSLEVATVVFFIMAENCIFDGGVESHD